MNRKIINVELPDRTDVREIWTDGYYRYINHSAPEDARIRYTRGAVTVRLNSKDEAEMMDILRKQPFPFTWDYNVIRMIRGLCVGIESDIVLFQYGIMVGKQMERARRVHE